MVFGSLVLSPPANDPLVSSFFHSPFPEPASLLTYGESRPRKTTLPVMPVNTAFRRAPVMEKWWAETPAICTPVGVIPLAAIHISTLCPQSQ